MTNLEMPTQLIGVVAAPQNGSTLATSQGPIQWTRSPNGTLQANGGGQAVTISAQDQSDGSWQNSAKYAKTGNAPYFSMNLVGVVAERNVACTFSAGSSQLTLTIANIDALVRSGTATLSGTWNGAAVHWTAQVDLTSNPVVSRPITGWPAGAFASELQQAEFFAPLGETLARDIVPSGRTTASPDHMLSAGSSIAKAGYWCMGSMAPALGPGMATGGTALALLCAGGALASFASDFVDWWNTPNTPTPPPPVGQGSEAPPPTDSGDDSQPNGGQGGDEGSGGSGGRTDLGGFQLGGGGGDEGSGGDTSRLDGSTTTYKEN